MTSLQGTLALGLLGLLLIPTAAGAQIPDTFTNLRLLDPDIEKERLVGTRKN